MSTFLNSNKVKVFPSSLRSAQNGDQSAGKYTSEKNLTGIIKTLANKDSFIINWGDSSAELVIDGYYFNLTALPDIPTVGNYYAGIRLDSAERLCSLADGGPDLDPESGSSFYGLGFSSSYTDFPSAYLQILEDGQLCKKSFHKFNAETIFFGEGEGKSLAELFNDSDILKVEAGGTGVSTMTPGWALVAGGQATADPAVTTTEPIVFRQITNKTSSYLLDSNSINLVNERTVYNALAFINNSKQTGSTNIYAPTNGGNSKYILVAQGTEETPLWTAPATVAANILNDQGLTVKTSTTAGTDYLLGGSNNSTAFKILPENLLVKGLKNSVTLQTKLSSTTAATFDGTQPTSDIGVSGTLAVGNGGTGQTSFTSGNLLVGNGSGALGNIAKTSANTANTVVVRDGSGNFSAGTITASLNGHASSDLALSGGTMTGQLKAQNNANYTTGQMRNVFLIADGGTAPTGGNGDIWITYIN